ncbi:unnamed protein product [Caenorhabditis angaria]|uniref:Fe2OG dioxygenase domain-containing protein n=1 Tax=Caenorhabditis angaria TaxID=860376 RepID=A0A9P1IMJ1_9PELO|nr:unnamed protein product [Caenorhabditis angaria]
MNANAEKIRDQYEQSEEEDLLGEENLFRPIFKKYKKRRPMPDFSGVIDVRDSQNFTKYGVKSRFLFENSEILEQDRTIAENLGLRPLPEWRVCEFPNRPGLYVLPAILLKSHTPKWLENCQKYARSGENKTNLVAHGGEMNDTSLRWTTLGIEYDWNTKEYPADGKRVPEEFVSLAKLISGSLKLGEMRADATIVNFYPPKTALSPHVDKSERSNAPLISLSLGQTAVYLSGGLTLSEEPIPIWLRNGDILVMHAAQRLVYHAIPCVGVKSQATTFEKTEFPETKQETLDYLNCSRVNITMRQVNEY